MPSTLLTELSCSQVHLSHLSLSAPTIVHEHTPIVWMATRPQLRETNEEQIQMMEYASNQKKVGVVDPCDSQLATRVTPDTVTAVPSNEDQMSILITITDEEINSPPLVGEIEQVYSPESADDGAIHIQIRDAPIEDTEAEKLPSHESQTEVVVSILEHARIDFVHNTTLSPLALPGPFVTIIKPTENSLHKQNTTLPLATTGSTTPGLSVSKASYETAPYEILHLIATYLDGHSLSRLNCVDTASHEVTSRKDLWTSLLEKKWKGDIYINDDDRAQLKGVSRIKHPRQYYRLRYEAAMENRRQQLLAHDVSMKQVRLSRRSFICHYLNDVLIVPTIMLMFLLFTIFLFVQLSRNESITWFTCWPLIVIGSLLFFTVSLLYFKQWWFDSDGILKSIFYSDSTSFIKRAIMDQVAGGLSRFPHTCLWLMLSSFSLFLFVLALKLTGTYLIGWSWWQVLLPLHVFLFFGLISPLLGFFPDDIDHWRDNWAPRLISLIVFFAPMLAFLITLNVHLDGHPIRMMVIFIPLWILDLLVFLALFVYVSRNWAVGVSWLLLIGPFVTFQILLGLKLDGESHMIGVAYHLIFIPLYLTQLLLLAGTIYVAILQRDDFRLNRVWDLLPHRPWVPIPEK